MSDSQLTSMSQSCAGIKQSDVNRVKESWIALCGLVRKEVTRFLRIWRQTILPSAITMTLYFMIFGHVIGGRIGTMAGIPYMVFITPGLIMMAVITNSFSNVVSSFFIARYMRSIEEILVSPMSNLLIVSGYIIAGSLRGFLVGLLTLVIGCLFSGMQVAHPLLSLLIIILTSVLFSLAGFLNGLFAKKIDDTSIMTTFVLTPLIYLGGVFYSVNLLPPLWRLLSHFNPIYYMINLFRYSMLGTAYAEKWWALDFVVLLIASLYTLAVWLLNKGINIKP